MRSLFLLVIIWGSFVMLTSCETEESKAWDAAVAKGSIAAIDSFLMEHPNGSYLDEALAKKESFAWAYAKNRNTIYAYKAYLRDYPEGEYRKPAKLALDSIPAIEANNENLRILTTNSFTGKIDYGNQVIQIILLNFMEVEETGSTIRFIANVNASNIRKTVRGEIDKDDFTLLFQENPNDKVQLNLAAGKAYKRKGQMILESIKTDQYWRLEQN